MGHAVQAQDGLPVPPPARDCALVSGGTGSQFTDVRVDKIWLEVNRKITDSLVDDLRENGYGVEKVFTEVADRTAEPPKAIRTLARVRCTRLIQVSHDVGQSAEGPFFGFTVSVLRFEPSGGQGAGAMVRAASDYTRSYRYPRNTAEMDKFHTGTFANTVYADLLSAHAIDGFYNPDPDSQVVRDAYASAIGGRDQTEYRARVITVSDLDKARQVIERIQAGEPFETVAEEVSPARHGAPKGGDLGWVHANGSSPELIVAMRRLAPKGLSSVPLRVGSYWHVVEVLEVRALKIPSFDEAKVQLAARMKRQHDEELLAPAH